MADENSGDKAVLVSPVVRRGETCGSSGVGDVLVFSSGAQWFFSRVWCTIGNGTENESERCHPRVRDLWGGRKRAAFESRPTTTTLDPPWVVVLPVRRRSKPETVGRLPGRRGVHATEKICLLCLADAHGEFAGPASSVGEIRRVPWSPGRKAQE